MKYLSLSILILCLFACQKSDNKQNNNEGVELILKNSTDYDFENFSFNIVLSDDSIEKVVFGKTEIDSESDIETVESISFMFLEQTYYFGHDLKAMIDGKEYSFQTGFCGTGLDFGTSTSDTYITEVTYLDLENRYIGFYQYKK